VIDKLLSIARQYIGTKESPAGSNNVIFNTHYYGRPVSGSVYPWCVVCVWDIFRLADLSALFYDGGKVASCTVLKGWARQKGRWVTAGYRRGDVVIFDWDGNGSTDHMGFTEAVSADGKTLTTIEGNTGSDSDSNGGQVMRRARSVRYVNGAFRPKYEEVDEMAQIIEDIAKAAGLSVEETVARLAKAIKDDAWEQDGVNYLMNNKFITETRPPGTPVSWGEFGIVQRRVVEAMKR
jgi:hypothetical protein